MARVVQGFRTMRHSGETGGSRHFFNDEDYHAYEDWRGHLWQGRFSSFIMDEQYLLTCARYVGLNPVRAGLVKQPEAWPWSSAGAHIKGKDDVLVKTKPLGEMVRKSWKQFLAVDAQEAEIELLRKHERTGGRGLRNSGPKNKDKYSVPRTQYLVCPKSREY